MPACAPLPLATALRVLAAMKSISADCGWRSIAGEGRGFTRKQPVGQISVQPRSEKYFASPFGRNSFIDSAVSSHRGAYRDRHGRGEGCGVTSEKCRETTFAAAERSGVLSSGAPTKEFCHTAVLS